MDVRLVLAVMGNKVDEVEALLKSGASPNACGIDGYSVLVSACYKGYISIVQHLLQKGANVNKATPYYGRTALHYAALNNQSKVVRILLENGCDSNIKGKNGETALQLAVRWNQKNAADAIKAFTVKTLSASSLPGNFDTKVEETSNGDNIASDKKDDARRQRRVLLVVLLCVGTAVLAVVLQGIIYPTDSSIGTSLREPTRIREKAAVPLATDSDNDQVTSVELLKIAVEAGSHWHSFGIHLGCSGETLRQYEKQFNEASRLLYEILDNWRKQKGKQATKNAVLEACRQAGVRRACERVFIR